MSKVLLTVAIQGEQHVVMARQRARQIATLLGFEGQDQTRIATAVSEIARNAFRYAGGGKVEFLLEGETAPQLLMVRVTDQGPGIADLAHVLSGRFQSTTGMGLGLLGAQRLMDQVDVRTGGGRRGTEVLLKKILPLRAPLVTPARLEQIVRALLARAPAGALEEMQQQNQELLRALSELRERQEDLIRLNRELEDTNRGVVALYAELDEKADHLRRADEMKSRFLSNMSHEFRTPLNSIRALSRLLLERIDGELTAEQEKQVEFIAKSANDLSGLVDDLLDLAKIEAGKTEVRPIEFSVANLFSALRGMLRPLLVSDEVTLVFDEPDGELTLYTDEGKVSQILRNFISNAIKFTEKGEVRVSARFSADRRTVIFAVADTGIGIAPEDQARIFDEFTQVPHALQSRVKGTGLGLPLCQRLARLLGGEISLVSQPQVGSTFTATLPAQFEPPPELAGRSLDAVLDPGLTPVLVVEDEAESRFIYEKLLAGSRYQPVAARSLREARELLARVAPRAIILDLRLRGEDSWSWLVELKREPQTATIPVVIASTVNDERKGFALGADAYCVKPVSRQALLAHLDALTGRRVLVIDDDPAARYVLTRLLSDGDTRVIEAGSCESGLDAARRSRPAAIFLDLHLPDGSGEDVLGELRDDASFDETPVAIVTSRSLSSEDRLRLAARAQLIVEKSELTAAVTRAFLARSGA
jgi:signal transduction histidine kinase/DNA-binding response OmpR family regulator